MAKQPETKFKERIYPFLKRLENTYCEKIDQEVIRGTADFHLCINGNFVALELKRGESEDLEPLQQHKAEMVRKAGGIAIKVTPENWNEVYAFLLKLARGKIRLKDQPRTKDKEPVFN